MSAELAQTHNITQVLKRSHLQSCKDPKFQVKFFICLFLVVMGKLQQLLMEGSNREELGRAPSEHIMGDRLIVA